MKGIGLEDCIIIGLEIVLVLKRMEMFLFVCVKVIGEVVDVVLLIEYVVVFFYERVIDFSVYLGYLMICFKLLIIVVILFVKLRVVELVEGVFYMLIV